MSGEKIYDRTARDSWNNIKAFSPSACLKSFFGTRDISPLILTNAFANFEGFPVICAEPLSAEYSLYREIALIIRKLIIQVEAPLAT